MLSLIPYTLYLISYPLSLISYPLSLIPYTLYLLSHIIRVGSVSCYPAAFARLITDRTSFVVLVEMAPLSSNWLTFGLARTDQMANSSSDGVGRSRSTWGISDDRSSAESKTVIAECGKEIGVFRKLRVGDTLCALVDTSEGWVEVSVNDHEFHHRFFIPPGSPSEYCFAMTFANDHKVSILNHGDYFTGLTASYAARWGTVSQGKGQGQGEEDMLTVEQTLRFNALKKQLRMISSGECDSSGLFNLTTGSYASRGEEWVKLCGGEVEAMEGFDKVKQLLDCVVNVRQAKDWPEENSSIAHLTSWTSLVHAAIYHRERVDRERHESDLDSANSFYMLHGDDAPFIAAISLVDYYLMNTRSKRGKSGGKRDEESEEDANITASLAFMRVFSDECNAWYEYNNVMHDPLIPNLHKTCTCLPRHIRDRCGH